ncbi:MAG: leucine-rich repeat domain-containing protein, partial [Thermoguttaceae bacterium]|nr:leucine-rich repeat domain-containing protein [Thermoguttaceae bacterium]
LPDGLQTLGFRAFTSSLSKLNVSSDSQRFKLIDGVLFSKDGKTLIAYFKNLRKDCDKGGYVVPDGVETIQNGAFCGVESLTSVAFPPGLKTLGDDAFLGCRSLTSVEFPDGLQRIGKEAFTHCSSLTSVVFPNGLQTLGESAFWECSSLTSVVFPASLLTIGDEAFYGCESLTSVELSNGLQKIGANAFDCCADDLTLYGAVGSVAEKYAAQNELRFKPR